MDTPARAVTARAAATARHMIRRSVRIGVYRALAVLLPVLLLELACRVGIVGPMVMPAPSQMLIVLAEMLASGAITAALVKTFTNVLVAFVLAALAGILAGALIHRLSAVRGLLEPLLSTYYAIPIYAFYPLFIVVFAWAMRRRC